MSVYRHILVPTDFSTYSEAAAARAQQLAMVFEARLSLLHVVDYVPPGYVAIELPANFGSESWLVARAVQKLEQWVATNGLKVENTWVQPGAPKTTVIDVARAEHVDLIVIGTSGPDITKRIIGSTTTGVLQHAPCDVLSVQSVAAGVN